MAGKICSLITHSYRGQLIPVIILHALTAKHRRTNYSSSLEDSSPILATDGYTSRHMTRGRHQTQRYKRRGR